MKYNSVETLESKILGATICWDTFIEYIAPFELSTNIKIELEIGVAEYGSWFNVLWRGTNIETMYKQIHN